MSIKCPNGHIFEMSYNHFQQGDRCPKCWDEQKWSIGEKEILAYVQEIYTGIVIPNDRTTIFNPKTGKYCELDIYCKDIKKAIEFGAVHWHKNRKYYDALKDSECKRLCIDLLRVDYTEWMKCKDFDVIKNFIQQGQ